MMESQARLLAAPNLRYALSYTRLEPPCPGARKPAVNLCEALAQPVLLDLGEAALHKPSALPLEPPVVNNYRVKDLDAAEEAPSEEEFEEDLEEEVVDRDALKKQSGTILDKATKKTKKRKGKKAA